MLNIFYSFILLVFFNACSSKQKNINIIEQNTTNTVNENNLSMSLKDQNQTKKIENTEKVDDFESRINKLKIDLNSTKTVSINTNNEQDKVPEINKNLEENLTSFLPVIDFNKPRFRSLTKQEVLEALLIKEIKLKFSNNKLLLNEILKESNKDQNLTVEFNLKKKYEYIYDDNLVEQDNKKFENPFFEAQYVAQTYLNKFLENIIDFDIRFKPQKPLLKNLEEIPEISILKYPVQKTLTKEPLETEDEFNSRKILYEKKYKQKIKTIDAKYQEEILKNKEEFLSNTNKYYYQIKIINKIFNLNKKFQQEIAIFKNQLSNYYKKLFIKNALQQSIGGFYIDKIDYDMDNLKLFITINSQNSHYFQKISFENLDKNKADLIKSNKNNLDLSLIFDINNSVITLNDTVELNSNSNIFYGKIEKNIQEFISLKLNLNKIKNKEFALKDQLMAIEDQNSSFDNIEISSNDNIFKRNNIFIGEHQNYTFNTLDALGKYIQIKYPDTKNSFTEYRDYIKYINFLKNNFFELKISIEPFIPFLKVSIFSFKEKQRFLYKNNLKLLKGENYQLDVFENNKLKPFKTQVFKISKNSPEFVHKIIVSTLKLTEKTSEKKDTKEELTSNQIALFIETNVKNPKIKIVNISQKFKQGITLEKEQEYFIEISKDGYEVYQQKHVFYKPYSVLKISLKKR
jgi:hypothetical protein